MTTLKGKQKKKQEEPVFSEPTSLALLQKNGRKGFELSLSPRISNIQAVRKQEKKHFCRWAGVRGGENVRSVHKKTNTLYSVIKPILGLQPSCFILFFGYQRSSFVEEHEPCFPAGFSIIENQLERTGRCSFYQ